MSISDKNGPFRIRLHNQVISELGDSFIARAGEHDAWCNRHGAVWVATEGGSYLGVEPDEFEYITLPPDGLPLAVTPQGARELVERLTARIKLLESLYLR